MSPIVKASKWQTDLLDKLYAKSPHPSRAQRNLISNETGLYVYLQAYLSRTPLMYICDCSDKTWIKRWFQKRTTSSSKTTSPPAESILSTERKSMGRSSSVPKSTSPLRPMVRTGDISVHETPSWEDQIALSSEHTFYSASGYNVQDPGSSSQPFQLRAFPLLYDTPQANPESHAQAQVQATSQPYSMIDFPTYLEPQPQKSRAMSPSLGYIPSAFPVSIFTDSPPKQQHATPWPPVNSSRSTSAPFLSPALQDPYSIPFPLTYSPRRRQGPSPSFVGPYPEQSQSHPQAAFNFNYDYDIPSELSSLSSVQSQSTTTQTNVQPNYVPQSAKHLSQKQPPYHMPIAYTAKLADLTAFALHLKTPQKPADAGASGEHIRNGMLNTGPNPETVLPKSGDMDDAGKNSVSQKGRLLSTALRLFLC